MKVESTGKIEYQAGLSTLELVIAMAILVINFTAIILVVFGNQTQALDASTSEEALNIGREMIEEARAEVRADFQSVATTPSTTEDIYEKRLKVASISPCFLTAAAQIAWSSEHGRQLHTTIKSEFSNVQEAFRLGGDCGPDNPPTGGLAPTGTPINIGPGEKTNGLDVLNKKVYLALQDDQGFSIVDTSDPMNPICYGIGGTNCAVTVPYSAASTCPIGTPYFAGAEVYDIDVARAGNDRIYAYLARKDPILRFEVVDVTDPAQPCSIVKKKLNGLADGAVFSEGYRIYYYENKAYITTRETAGPELHVFNASAPWIVGTITEYANPKELNRTVNDFLVTHQNVGGTDYVLAYFVADSDLKEISAWNVGTATAMSEIAASVVNLTGDADAFSVYFSAGTRVLYVGRQANGDEELFAFDATNPTVALTELGKSEVGESITGIRVAGDFMYMISDSSNHDLIVFQSDPDNMNQVLIDNDNNSNKGSGIDFENNIIYAAFQQGSASLKLFHAQ